MLPFELVTRAATHLEIPDSDDYENVMQQSSQDHIKTTANVAYDRVANT